MLEKYGVLNLKNGSTGLVKRLMDQYNLINDDDYIIEKTKTGNTYFLTPESFKLCLIKSQKTIKYAKYYLFAEKCIKYYGDYQKQLSEQRLKNDNELYKYKYKTAKQIAEEAIDKMNILIEQNKKNNDI